MPVWHAGGWCRGGACAGAYVCRCRTCMCVCHVYVCVRVPCDCYDLLPCVCYDLVRMYVIMYDMTRYVRNTIRSRMVGLCALCGTITYEYVYDMALTRTNMRYVAFRSAYVTCEVTHTIRTITERSNAKRV